jgi:hypothetical protein
MDDKAEDRHWFRLMGCRIRKKERQSGIAARREK